MQPIRTNRIAYLKRPLWRNYLFAYALMGIGYLFGGVAAGPSGNRIFEVVGATMLFAGVLVFAAALVHCHIFNLGSRAAGIFADDDSNQGRLCHAEKVYRPPHE